MLGEKSSAGLMYIGIPAVATGKGFFRWRGVQHNFSGEGMQWQEKTL